MVRLSAAGAQSFYRSSHLNSSPCIRAQTHSCGLDYLKLRHGEKTSRHSFKWTRPEVKFLRTAITATNVLRICEVFV